MDSTTPPAITWPDGKRFAFTICDDTDHATALNVRPIYRLLADLGLTTTKTTWVYPPDPAHGFGGECLEDPAYRDFLLELKEQGFEIGLHGVRSGDSPRDMIEAGLARFAEVFGAPPDVHVNHAQNRDNVHWGNAWLSPLRRLFRRPDPAQDFEGDRRDSPHFWGDLLREHVRFVRGRTFRALNTLALDPYMPYHMPRFPYVDRWFSCSDGANGDRFEALLTEENLDRLEREGGAGIVYTHFAVGFLDDGGEVRDGVRRALTSLAGRPGWFVPVSPLLDHLAAGRRRVLRPWQELRIRANQRRDRGADGAS